MHTCVAMQQHSSEHTGHLHFGTYYEHLLLVAVAAGMLYLAYRQPWPCRVVLGMKAQFLHNELGRTLLRGLFGRRTSYFSTDTFYTYSNDMEFLCIRPTMRL